MDARKIAELRELERSEPPAPWEVAGSIGDTEAYRCVERGTIYRADDAVEFLVAARNAITQLLDEREALLAAAVHVRDRIELRADWDWCRGENDVGPLNEPGPCGDAVALAEIKAAVAKAEAP